MPARHPNQKIQLDHLTRQAMVYIRQSTLTQVRDNTGSTTRQYDLVTRAQTMGWPPERIRVIDQDQGQSGASAAGRDGFQQMVAEVGLKRVGAVLCLEASRLARSCADWYQLLEICALTNTLVIDEEGVYDPGQYNDRLLLGFKGTMSEAELHWLRQRLNGGKLAKAEQGQLRFHLPVGLVRDPAGAIGLDPDQEVQGAVRLLFDLFAQTGSALAVVTAFARQHLRFPSRPSTPGRFAELVWYPLSHARVLAVLHNPFYAGVYVYGRTVNRTHLLPGETPRIKGRTRRVAPSDWPVVIFNAHPGYLSWEQFQRNQQQLEDNRTWRPELHRGAVREGAALLQGIVLCGKCGRRMTVRYQHDRHTPTYECTQTHRRRGEPTCQTVFGEVVEAAVVQNFLAALQPAQLEIALAALEHLHQRHRQVEHQWQLRLERAHYEADLARRRFLAVDPENRLVGRTLEHDWNEKLRQVEFLQREFQSLPHQAESLLNPLQQTRLMALAQDIPALWNAASTTNPERKQLLRALIRDVTLTKQETTIRVAIRWQTQAVTQLDLRRPPKSGDACRTSPQVLARIADLAATHTDRQIAQLLNSAGLRSGKGGAFTGRKVNWIRFAYRIRSACPQIPPRPTCEPRGDGRFSAWGAAQILQVDVSTIADWCHSGRLDAIRETPHGPRWIQLTPEIIATLKKPRRRQHTRHAPLDPPAGGLPV